LDGHGTPTGRLDGRGRGIETPGQWHFSVRICRGGIAVVHCASGYRHIEPGLGEAEGYRMPDATARAAHEGIRLSQSGRVAHG